LISVGVVRQLVEYVERLGTAPADLLRAAKLKPESLETADTRFSRAAVYQLVEHAIELTGDPAFGLHWGETLGEGSFAPVSPLIAHAGTLRQALDALMQFHGLLSDQASFQIVEHDEQVTVRCVPLPGESLRLQRFSAEMILVGFRRLLRFFHTHVRFERISFAYAAPAYRSEYARIFDIEPSFAQPFSGITFRRGLMDVPAPHEDLDVHHALSAVAKRRLLRITQRTPYALRVREALVREALPHRADMDTVAKSLGLSARSLRRRLADEDKSYAEVANEARAIVAKHLLRDQRKTIQETAYELGFSDTSTFHRAFKSWTGMTPRAYRESHRDDQADD
jgi:AraC-like DNA-binding protein